MDLYDGTRGPASALRISGTVRRIILADAMIIWFSTYFVRLAWSNVSASVGTSLQATATELGSFITFFYIGYVTANVAGGFLVDRFGVRKVVCSAITALAVATMIFGSTSTLGQGLFVQLVMGLSAGSFYAALVKLVAAWFGPDERGLAYGMMSAAGPLAIVAANVAYPFFINHIGWTRLYLVLGLYALCVAVSAFLVIRNAPQRLAELPSKPLLPTPSIWNRWLMLLCLAGFGASWGTYGFTFCSNLLMVRGQGMTPDDASVVALLFGLGGTIAIPLYGLISDHLVRHQPEMIIVGLLSLILAMVAFGTRTTFLGFCVAGFCMGVAAYSFWPLLSAMLARLIDERTLGTSAGIANASWQMANIIVPLAIGQLLDRTGSTTLCLICLGAGPVVGLISVAVLRGMIAADRSAILAEVRP